MNDHDRYAAGGGGQPQPAHATASGRSATAARIVLIESRTLLRECLAYALTSFLPGLSIDVVNSVAEIIPGPARLLLIGLDTRSECQPDQLRETVQQLRRVGEGSPIGAYLHVDSVEIAALLSALGVAGTVLPSASVEIAIASVRLMVAGGAFLPAIPREAREPPELDASVAELAPQRPPAEAIAVPNEFPLPLPDITARERDVLKSLARGRANKIIAYDLQISEATVKVHLRNLMRKLHVTNRTQVAMRFGAAEPEIVKSNGSSDQSPREAK